MKNKTHLSLIFFLLIASPSAADTAPGYPGLSPQQRGTLGLNLDDFQVNTYNGNLTLKVPLFIMPGRGLPLECYLVYNTDHRAVSSPFGTGWSFSYNIRYQRHGSGDVTIVWGTGRQDRFRAVSLKRGGGFDPPIGFHMTLSEPSPGLLVLRDKRGCGFVFAHPGHRKLTEITDPNGNQLVLDYDPAFRLRHVVDASGRTMHLDYNSNGRLMRLEDISGNREYDFSYDAGNRLTSVRDPLDQETLFAYDTDNLLVGLTDKRNNTATVTYTTPAHHTGTRLPASIVKGGVTTLYAYDQVSRRTTVNDARGNDWVYTYDANGRTQSLTDPQLKSILLAWDGAENLTSVTNRNGFIDTFSYDTLGNRLTHTNPLAQTSTRTYDPIFCRPSSFQDRNGNDWTYAYDALGNLDGITDPLLGQTTITYDTFGQPGSGTNPLLETTTYLYDGNGNMTQITDPIGGQRRYEYDSISRRTASTDGNGNTTRYEYDLLDRLTVKETADGSRRLFTYDPNDNPISDTNARGATTHYIYDSLDRLSGVEDPLGNSEGYVYDPMGNRTELTDRNGRASSYGYDSLNRVISTTSPMGHTWTYGYDFEGNPTTRTDPLGQTITRAYDDIGRVVSRTLPGPLVTSYTYDSNDNLLQATQPGSTIDMTYDALDRKLTITDDDLSKTLTLTYGPSGTLGNVVRPDNDTQMHEYDAFDRISRITADGQQFDYTHDSGGRRTRIQRPTLTTDYTYDILNRLVVQDTSDGVDNLTHSFVYGSDNLVETREDATSNTMTFDPLDRMSRDVSTGPSPYDFNYLYDANGNITGNSGTNPFFPTDPQTFSYNNDNEVATETGTSFGGPYTRAYTYDDNGNLTQTAGPGTATVTYTYDALNRLVTGTDSGVGGEIYSYDALDRLQSVHVPAAVLGELGFQRFFYDQDNRIIINYDMAGTIQEQYWHNRGTVLVDSLPGIETDSVSHLNTAFLNSGLDDLSTFGADDFTVQESTWVVETLENRDIIQFLREGFIPSSPDPFFTNLAKALELARKNGKPWLKPQPPRPGPFFEDPGWWGDIIEPKFPQINHYGFPRQPDDYLLRKVASLTLFFLLADPYGNISGGSTGLLAGFVKQLYDLLRRITVYGGPGLIGAGGQAIYRDRINSILGTGGRACDNFSSFRYNQPKREDPFDPFEDNTGRFKPLPPDTLPHHGEYFFDEFESFRQP